MGISRMVTAHAVGPRETAGHHRPASSLASNVFGDVGASPPVHALLTHICPLSLQLGRLGQRLQYHAILFGFFAECVQLLGCCARRYNFESRMDALEADGDILRYTKRPAKIQVSFDRYLNSFDRYSHGGG